MAIRVSTHHARARHPIAGRPRGWERARIILLASQFNRPITSALVDGATQTLRAAGIPAAQIHLLWVPGAFELPVAAAWAAQSSPAPHAIIALGTLIKGETAQYAVIAHALAQGLSQVAVSANIPVTFGVIVADTMAQAEARAGGAMGNRGTEAAEAALSMLALFRRLQHASSTSRGTS